MSSKKKRARELARRRRERWQSKQIHKAQRRRKVTAIIWSAVVVAALVAAVVYTTPWDSSSQSSDSPTPSPTMVMPSAAPPPAIAEQRAWDTTMATNVGDIQMTLDGVAAPQAVANFVTLAKNGFFNGTTCHRITTSETMKILQCGSPTGTSSGGPGYTFGPIENAPTDDVYPAGTVAMARAEAPNSMGSQFFLVYGDSALPTDTGGYTVFGTITSGLEALQQVAAAGTTNGKDDGPPASPVSIEGVETK